MKKLLIIVAAIFTGGLLYAKLMHSAKPKVKINTTNFFDLSCKTIDGSDFKFSQLKGKKVLIVNVASYCGYTGQYETLQKLSEQYKDKLVVIGFPCNQFGMQEPGSTESIKSFCSSKYHVTFLMMDKLHVKGKDQHPVYQWLTSKALNGVEDTEVKWNFNKYLINEDGKYMHYFPSKVEPLDESITSLISK
ncbi:MAG: glutathione peroxidase [Bacteroidetes bacterium]|nr:glutathione peroxidase [Bacteroidota bacterium]